MAGVAYYNTGTATVAVNSKTVTGTGTNWLSVVGGLTAIKAGDKFGIHVGRPIIIASVDSNTQLTLEDNWPGPAQTNAAYRIELTNPDVIAVEALRRVLGSLSGGILYGVSQLTAAPNKALTIDETGAVALADLTTFGKSLIAALNSSAAYGALGVIPNAQLPTRLRDLSTAVTDANAVLETGVYSVSTSTTGIPVAAAGVLDVKMYSTSGTGVQTYTRTSVANPDVWYRIRVSGAWGSWMRNPFAQTSPTDITANAAMLVGAFGLGSSAILLVATDDLNNLPIATCSYRWGSTAVPSNAPSSGSYLMEQISFGSGGCAQTAYNLSGTNIIWHRKQAGGVWTSWTRIDGDVSGPATAVTNNSVVGFNGTTGKLIKQLTVTEALASMGPVFGGTAPRPANAGVGISDGNFNNVNVGGVYTISGNWIGGPYNTDSTPLFYTGILEVEIIEGGSLVVQVYRHENGISFKRFAIPGTWSAWITEGDVTGPSSSVDNALASFSGTTGKVLKGTPAGAVTNSYLANVATGTIKGRTAAGTGAVQDLTAAQARTVMDVVPSAARQVRVGAQGVATTVIDQWTIAPSGSFLTAIRVDGIYAAREVAYRAVQQTDVSGNWVTVAQA